MSDEQDRRTRNRTARFTTWLAAPPATVWDYVCDPRNLDAMTPSWLRFRVETPMPVELAPGTLIDYRLGWHGIPLRWRSRIVSVDPTRSLTYEQARGPYRRFVHEHQFEIVEGGTEMVDRVDWTPRFAWLTGRYVLRDIEALFAARTAHLESRFGIAA